MVEDSSGWHKAAENGEIEVKQIGEQPIPPSSEVWMQTADALGDLGDTEGMFSEFASIYNSAEAT